MSDSGPSKRLALPLFDEMIHKYIGHSTPYLTSISAALSGSVFLLLAPFDALTRFTAFNSPDFSTAVGLIPPGMHLQQQEFFLHRGEYPACAAMTSGYVFRIENAATVAFLQHIGQTGSLTTLHVDPPGRRSVSRPEFKTSMSVATALLTVAHNLSFLLLPLSAFYSKVFGTPSTLLCSALLIARSLSAFVISRVTDTKWSGASEPGVEGDLMILVSQDKWIRLQGLVDDLKPVTSGTYMRPPTMFEGFLLSASTTSIYVAVGMAAIGVEDGRSLLPVIVVSLFQLIILGWHNATTTSMSVKGRVVSVSERKYYARRTDLTEELVKETGEDHWAIGLGMMKPEKERVQKVIL